MAVEYSITLGLRYNDGESRSYKMTYDNTTTTTTSIKQKIKAINDDTSTYAAPMKATFVSNNGAPLRSIYSAKITATEEEVLIG